MKRLFVGLLFLIVNGCEMVDDEQNTNPDANTVLTEESALLGGQDYEESGDYACTQEEKVAIRHAGILARTIIQSDAYMECIDWTMRSGGVNNFFYGPYTPCSTDPYRTSSLSTQIGKVQSIVRNPNPIFIEECKANWATIGNYGHGEYDTVNELHVPDDAYDDLTLTKSEIPIGMEDWPNALLQARDDEVYQIASTLVHEAIHTHGYSHDCGYDNRKSVPWIVQSCINKVWDTSVKYCDQMACPVAKLNLIESYDWRYSLGGSNYSSAGGLGILNCTCVRDPNANYISGIEDPATPKLDVNELDDMYGWSLARGDFDDDGFVDLALRDPLKLQHIRNKNEKSTLKRNSPDNTSVIGA